MSRVTYTNTDATPEQELLRTTHGMRLVEDAEEGLGVNIVPPGVYGFTYSPALPNAPLFRVRRFRSFEIHRRADGEIFIVGFVTAAEALGIAEANADVAVRLQPEPETDVDTLVVVPYSRISHHRQYSVRTEHGLSLTVSARTKGLDHAAAS